MDFAPMRRVVTGLNEQGKSCIISDGPPSKTLIASSGPVSWMWATDDQVQVPHDGSDPIAKMVDWFPSFPGTCLIIEWLEPYFGVDGLPEAEGVEDGAERVFEDIGIRFNARYSDATGVHSSDTIDYAIIISGELCLQMEDGNEVTLKQGDCVVQTGVRHTWRNRSADPCNVAFIIIGAERTADPEA
jgi:hypothetical protein